jgi:hypothetical protein
MNYDMKQFRITILLTVLMSMFGAKVFAGNGLVSDRGGGINNQGGSWLEISHVG